MNFKSFIILLISIVFITQSCKTDFEINAPYNDIPVVFAALDQSVDTQYVKINKTYLGTGNNTLYAGINDSVLFKNLSATIDEVKNGEVINSYLLSEKWISGVAPGLFYGDSQKVYFFVPNGSLDFSADYKLTINIDEGRKTATATTKLVEEFAFAQLFKQQLFSGVGFKNGNGDYSSILIKWTTAKGALKYESGLRFVYDEYNQNGIEEKVIKWSFGKSTSLTANGGEDLSKEVLGDGFYKLIAARLKDYPNEANVTKRVFKGIEFSVAAAGEDLSTYIGVNEPSNSIVSDRPTFSNVDGGLGVFSSRTNLVLKEVSPGNPLVLNSNSQIELQSGQYTGNLKFQP